MHKRVDTRRGLLLLSGWPSCGGIVVRPIITSFLYTALSAVLIQPALFAAPKPVSSAPVGVILQADHARIGSDTAAPGTTVFAGDALATSSGSMRIRFASSQAYLLAGSTATLSQVPQGFGAELTSGTIILSSAQGEPFHLVADGATIRPSTDAPTSAQITRVSPTELTLLARKGSLTVSMDDDVKTVPEGASYRMMIQPPDAAAAVPAGQRGGVFSAGRNRFLFFALAIAAVAIAIGVYLATVSPSRL